MFGLLYNSELNGFAPGDHSFTFAHFPISMAASIAAIQVIEEENLIQRANQMGKILTDGLWQLAERFELIGDIRGPGLMVGIELVKNRQTREPARKEATRFIEEGLKRGVIFGESKYLGLGNIVKIKPALVINESQIERVLKVFEQILEVVS